MPIIVHEGKEQHLSSHEAEELLRLGLVHIPNPFDQGSLQPCPDLGWREIQDFLSARVEKACEPV